MTLQEGIDIKLITAPCFLATKLEAFDDKEREGNGDVFVSRDFGDVIRVIDGRQTLIKEVLTTSDELKTTCSIGSRRYLVNVTLRRQLPNTSILAVRQS